MPTNRRQRTPNNWYIALILKAEFGGWTMCLWHLGVLWVYSLHTEWHVTAVSPLGTEAGLFRANSHGEHCVTWKYNVKVKEDNAVPARVLFLFFLSFLSSLFFNLYFALNASNRCVCAQYATALIFQEHVFLYLHYREAKSFPLSQHIFWTMS